jgi:hypothetical protein
MVLISATLAAEYRTWNDTSGKFSLKAKYVAVKDGKVALQKEDGSQVEIELRKLCAADQKYVSEQQDDNPFKPKNDMPAEPSGGGLVAATTTDWSSVRMVDPAPATTKWEVPVSATASSTGNRKPVALPASKNFFEKIRGLAIDGPGKRGVVGYTTQDWGPQQPGTTRLVLCDLESGKALGNATTPGTAVPLALTDGGGRVLLRKEEGHGFGTKATLELRSLDSPQLKLVARWTPGDDLKNNDRDVTWAAFLDDKRLATLVGTRLAVWSVDPLKPEYQLTILSGSLPALSPNRKLLAFAGNHEYGVLDLAAGKVLAMRPLPHPHAAALAFSPSGAKLACAAFTRAEIVDTANGNVLADLNDVSMAHFGALAWVSEEHLLCGTVVVDPMRQVRVWDYPGAEALVPATGYCWAAVGDVHNRPGALLPLKLPHPAALTALERTLADPNYVVLKAGMTVAVDVDGITDAGQREPARTALTKKLEANGFKVGANTSVTLKASTEVGEEREVRYHSFGRPFGGDQAYKIRDYRSTIKFVWEDQVLWQTGSSNVPGIIVHLKQGETMEQHLRDQEKPNYQIFETVTLPKQLTKPTKGSALGMTRISATGLQ